MKTDLLLTNAIVITMNPNGDIYQHGAVAIQDNSIIAVGESEQLQQTYNAVKTIDCANCVISPGLINAHTHVPMTFLRGLADDLRLDVWLYGFIMPVENEFVTPEFCYDGTLLACAEMIRSGITTFCDMYYYEDHIAKATSKAGLRAICAETILKFPAPDAGSYDESLEYCETFIKKWKGHPLITPGVAPHAAYTSTSEMLKGCVAMAKKYDVPLHIHVAETTHEQQGSREDNGMTVVPWLESLGVFDINVIAAHCVHLEDTDMFTMKKANSGIVHCPSSNLKLASGVAPIHRYLEMGLNVGIGTDGTASNNDLDMVEETRLAAFLQKGIFNDPTLLPASKAWELATIGGAKAIHLDHITGSIEIGKRADIIVIQMDSLHQIPFFTYFGSNVYSQLVYSTKSTDVRDVIVDGNILMEDRQLTTLNLPELQEKAIQLSQRIDTFLHAREKSIMSKLLAVGSGVVPVETFEIQAKVKIKSMSEIETYLHDPLIEIERSSVRNQYDIYFIFDGGHAERLRYREDEILDSTGNVKDVFYRITVIEPIAERTFDNSVLLTRSRYSVSATKSLRFYREYFTPPKEIEVEKERRRYHIVYKGTKFAVNIDTLIKNQGMYLEIKSRTWSARDAEQKAKLIGDLLQFFGLEAEANTHPEYFHVV